MELVDVIRFIGLKGLVLTGINQWQEREIRKWNVEYQEVLLVTQTSITCVDVDGVQQYLIIKNIKKFHSDEI